MSKRKTEYVSPEKETRQLQVKMLKAFLDGMECYLYWDNVKECIMLGSTRAGNYDLPIIQEGE